MLVQVGTALRRDLAATPPMCPVCVRRLSNPCLTSTPVLLFQPWLLLDSRVVDVPMSYNPIIVTPLLESLIFQWPEKWAAFLGRSWSRRPRNPIRAPVH